MRVRSVLLVALSLSSLALSFACSSQGEGEDCSQFNGNDDCQSNLICKSAPGLVNSGLMNTYRCCPSDDSQATTAVCMITAASTGDSGTGVGAFPPDAGHSPDAGHDAGEASKGDGAVEAATGGDASPTADASSEASATDASGDQTSPAALDGSFDASDGAHD